MGASPSLVECLKDVWGLGRRRARNEGERGGDEGEYGAANDGNKRLLPSL